MSASDEPTPWAVAVRLATASRVPTELLRSLHDLHGRQWQLEDASRKRRASARSIATAKAEIDISNARRHQMIDAIDAAAHVAPAEGATRYYSETIGELCDRLLVFEHKLSVLERFQGHAAGPSDEPPSAAVCHVRAVCAHLSFVVTQLLEDIAAGRATMPPRARVKVYDRSTGGIEVNPGPDGDLSAATDRRGPCSTPGNQE